MKLRMTKHAMERFVLEQDQATMEAAGWTVATKEQAQEEIIRLKPAVKNKATVTALEEANINKGDE